MPREPETLVPYEDYDRAIFGPYDNGIEEVHADPVRAYRELVLALDGDPNADLTAFNSPVEAESLRAEGRLVQAARVAFELIPFNPACGSGATDDQALRVLRTFLEWLEKNGPRAATWRT